ncbi:Phage Tail Collar domain protein, partial [Snodgrassella alvi SCGC AB-598-P14]
MSKNPVLIPQAFAANGSKNNIQNTRQPGQDPEDATWSDGFPNVTMQPVESGGLPPKGMDFNGIFNALSATIVHMQKGNLFYFDKAYCDAFGGYQKGAILLADDGTKVFISVADKNTNNPNQNPQYWEVIAGIGLNAASASKLFEGRNIGGVFFDGTQDIDLPGVNTRGNQDTTGNASTATYAGQIAARKIGGVTFNAKTDIDLPGVNIKGNQDTSGNAATATKLQNAACINGIPFDGSKDINATPAGAVQFFAMDTAPVGWLKANGAA